MTHHPITRAIKQVERNYTGWSFLMWTGKLGQWSNQMKLTFHPRRSLLLSPDLSVWKNESAPLRTSATLRELEKKASHTGAPTHHFCLIFSMSHTPKSPNKYNCARSQPATMNAVVYNLTKVYKCQSGANKVEDKAITLVVSGCLHESFISQPYHSSSQHTRSQYEQGRSWHKIMDASWDRN